MQVRRQGTNTFRTNNGYTVLIKLTITLYDYYPRTTYYTKETVLSVSALWQICMWNLHIAYRCSWMLSTFHSSGCHMFYHVKKLGGLSQRANYTGRATAASWRSKWQRLRVENVAWSAQRIPTAVSRPQPLLLVFVPISSSAVFTMLSGLRSRMFYHVKF
jgi:hypothetical protein